MATPGGFAAFIKKRINDLFKDILNDYGEWLTTKASRYVLSDKLKGKLRMIRFQSDSML